jgi:hypothetical protein
MLSACSRGYQAKSRHSACIKACLKAWGVQSMMSTECKGTLSFTGSGTVLVSQDDLLSCYSGPSLHGLRHGYGTYRYPNSAFRYRGEYVEGRKEGMLRLRSYK